MGMQTVRHQDGLPIIIHPTGVCNGQFLQLSSSGSRLVFFHPGLKVSLCFTYVDTATAARDLVYNVELLLEWILIFHSHQLQHAWNHYHQVEWDEIKVLDEAANNTTLLIKEALHIRLTDTETLITEMKELRSLTAGQRS